MTSSSVFRKDTGLNSTFLVFHLIEIKFDNEVIFRALNTNLNLEFKFDDYLMQETDVYTINHQFLNQASCNNGCFH